MIGWGTKWAAGPRVTLFELVVFFVAHLANVIGKGGHRTKAPAPAPTPVKTVAPNKSEQATDEQEKQRQSEQEKRQ